MFTEKFTTIIKSLEAIIGVALIKLKLYYDRTLTHYSIILFITNCF